MVISFPLTWMLLAMSMEIPAELSPVVQDLASADAAVRCAAAENLCRLGEDASPVAAVLVQTCADESESVRDWAVAALEELGPPAPSQIGELTALVANEDVDVSFWAATLLGRTGSQGASAARALADVVSTHPELAARERAAWALGKIGPPAVAASDALQQAAKSDAPRLARLATRSLEQIAGN